MWRGREPNGSAYQIRVKAYDGSQWIWEDGGSSSGINYDYRYSAGDAQMAVFAGKLYVAWAEYKYFGTGTQIRIKAYDGSQWTWADGATPGSGMDFDPANDAGYPRLAVFGDKLYAAWDEVAYEGTAHQIRLKAYDGSQWAWADGGAVNGINYDSSKDAYAPVLAVFNGKLYATWGEWNGPGASIGNSTTGWQVRVKAYDGSQWAWADGGASNGVNYDSSESTYYPELAVFNNSLYFTWAEYNGTAYEIRMAYGF